MNKAAILQPSYLPWAGVFSLIDTVDTYIFYDDVQFEVQSWQQRNRIMTPQGIKWLTVPVERSFGQKINEVKINFKTDWRSKHWATIEQSYSKSAFFSDSSEFWRDFYAVRFFYLADMTMYLTKVMAEGFDLNIPKFLKSSDFKLEGTKTDRLIDLLKQVGATEFYEGMAGKDYIEPDKFEKNGIKLTWWDYKPVPYEPHNTLYLSAIDLLFNQGEKSKEIIRSGKTSTT